jgi:hypothetical protein
LLTFINNLVLKTENPQVVESIKKKLFTDIFRNFVDLCVTKNFQIRLNATQLLQHAFVKKLPRKSLTDYFQLIEGILQEKSNKNKSMNFSFSNFFFLI